MTSGLSIHVIAAMPQDSPGQMTADWVQWVNKDRTIIASTTLSVPPLCTIPVNVSGLINLFFVQSNKQIHHRYRYFYIGLKLSSNVVNGITQRQFERDIQKAKFLCCPLCF